MNRGSRVEITRLKTKTLASCEGCAIHPDCTRERVRQHVEKSGHAARVVVLTTTRYTPLKETS